MPGQHAELEGFFPIYYTRDNRFIPLLGKTRDVPMITWHEFFKPSKFTGREFTFNPVRTC